jgi:hypothetical protein
MAVFWILLFAPVFRLFAAEGPPLQISPPLSTFASLRLCASPSSTQETTKRTKSKKPTEDRHSSPYGRDSTAGGAPAGAGLDSSFGIILTIWPSFMTWIGVWVLAATALARAAARIMAWSACWIQLAAFIVGRCC